MTCTGTWITVLIMLSTNYAVFNANIDLGKYEGHLKSFATGINCVMA